MKFIKCSFMVLALLLSGCAAHVISSQKNSDPIGDLSRINVIFLGSSLQLDPLRTLGIAVAEKFPKVFAEIGIASAAKSLPLAEIPFRKEEYFRVFGIKPSDGFILFITPLSTKEWCYGMNCSSKILVRTDLIRSQTNRVFWTAQINIDRPNMLGVTDSNIAEIIINAVMTRLQTDGVLPPKPAQRKI